MWMQIRKDADTSEGCGRKGASSMTIDQVAFRLFDVAYTATEVSLKFYE